ncbi:MAG: patatin-like phospholipase family protein [Armatimonadota bacterium]|nr:patatin-like phospholipase family protein [Armatimonadota bacterium]
MPPRPARAAPDVIGVFSGGAARIAAFVGAYREVHDRGWRFREVAGVSAGAIVAALIAAGATPQQMADSLAVGPADRVLVDPVPMPGVRVAPPALRAFAWLLDVALRRQLAKTSHKALLDILPGHAVWRVIRYLGMFGSHGLEGWLRNLLRDQIAQAGPGRVPDVVTFTDLRLPLTVVAADLTAGHEKVWSRTRTPGADVARAVAASCLAPFVFQPVAEDGHLYVDGGLVMDTPLAVLWDEEGAAPAASMVLEFVIATRPEPWAVSGGLASLIEMTARLVSVAVSSRRRTQRTAPIPIRSIWIDTRGAPSLAAHLPAEHHQALYELGRTAVRRCLDDEVRSGLPDPGTDA